MKFKTLLLAGGIGMLVACGRPAYQATDQSVGVYVPDMARASFMAEYPTATNIIWANYDGQVALPIDWEFSEWPAMDATDYVVKFDMNGDTYYGWYDSDGTWIGTAYVVADHASLPAAVTNTLNTQFSGYTISSVNKEFRKDRVAYEIEMKNDTGKTKLLVDGNGTIIRQKTKTY